MTEFLSVNSNGIDSTLSPPTLTQNNHVTSTPRSASKLRFPVINTNNCSMIKSASTSDLPLAAKMQLDTSAMSESEAMRVIS